MFVLLIELFFASYNKIPFTVIPDPAKGKLKTHWPLYIGGFLQYMTTVTYIGAMLMQNMEKYMMVFGVIATLVLMLIVRRYYLFRKADFRFVFEEETEPLMLSLTGS